VPAPAQRHPGGGRSETVWIVDDDRSIRWVLEKALQRENIPARSFDSADAALAELWPAGLGVARLFAHALPDYGYLGARVPCVRTPHAADFAARALTISNSAWLDEAAFARIVEVLRRVLAS